MRSPLRPSILCKISLIAAGAALALAGPLRADVKTAKWVSDSEYTYQIVHMPDLDQRRAAATGIMGLPGNGAMYCVPTSTLNLMIYCANHGFPEVWPGPGDYQNGLYGVATLNDFSLGVAMNTTVTDGTGGDGWIDGAKWWLNQSAPGKFTVSEYTASGNYSPTMNSMTHTAICGSLVSFAYGRYKKAGTYMGVPLLQRDGGHIVTLARSVRSGLSMSLYSRDPARPNDGQLLDQSAFGNVMYDVSNQLVTTSSSSGDFKIMSCLNYDSGQEKNAYIDQYVAIRPKAGYSFTSSGYLGVLKWFQPAVLGGALAKGETQIPIDFAVSDIVVHPDLGKLLAIVLPKTSGVEQILAVDLASKEVTSITSLPGASKIVFGRHRPLYVIGSNQVHCLDLEQQNPVVKTMATPYPVEAVGYDDEADEVVMLSTGASKIIRWDAGLTGHATTLDIPASIPMGGKSALSIDPTDGKVFFVTSKSASVYSVMTVVGAPPVVKEHVLPGMPFPTGLDCDDDGHLFATRNGILQEYAIGVSGGYEVVAGSSWTAFSPGPSFRITKSRDNFDPQTMSGPAWRHIDPSELASLVDGAFIPDCDNGPSNLEYGAGKPGSTGVPKLAGLDLPTLGLPSTLELSSAPPGAQPVLFLGLQQAALPFDGGMLHLNPIIVLAVPATVGPSGSLSITGTLPPNPNFCGITLYHQILYVDPGASGFYQTAQTNGLARTFGS